MEFVISLYEQLRGIQARLDDVTISNWALFTALAERDEAFADVYFAHKEAAETGEMGQIMASNLASVDALLTQMKADFGLE
jgi:hypothetical protein